MDERKVHLRVFTPRGLKFDEKADMVVMRCVNGDMGVLPGHETISAALGDGILRIVNGDTEDRIALFGGIATIENNRINILTSIAQRPGEIDLTRAEEDRQLAESLLQEKADDLKIQSYQVLLRRALVRIEVGIHPEDEEE